MGYKTSDLKEANRLRKAGFKDISLITERDANGNPTGGTIVEFEKNKDEIYEKSVVQKKPEPVVISQGPGEIKSDEKVKNRIDKVQEQIVKEAEAKPEPKKKKKYRKR